MAARDSSTATRRERRAAARAERAYQPRAHRAPTPRPWWRSPFVLVSAAAIVVGIGLVAFAMRGPARPSGSDVPGISLPDNPVPAALVDGQAIGRANAPVVLEVYEDYQCPVCGRFATSYLPRLIADYVAGGRLRIVDRPIAILGTGSPDESVEAAVGAVCAARQNRYWAYHDLLMANQDGENEGAFRSEILEQIADEADLDRAAWDACRSDPATARQVATDTDTALAAGINSTPTFVLNGQRIVGLVAYDDLARAIAALAPSSAPGTAP